MPIDFVVSPLGYDVHKREVMLVGGEKRMMVFVTMPIGDGSSLVLQLEESDATRLGNGLLGRVISTPEGDHPIGSPIMLG